MAKAFDAKARSDPKVAMKQFETAHGGKVFTSGIGGADYNPEVMFKQIDTALGLGHTVFTAMSRLDPDLAMRQIDKALGN